MTAAAAATMRLLPGARAEAPLILQLVRASDLEGGVTAIQDAPNVAAIVGAEVTQTDDRTDTAPGRAGEGGPVRSARL